LAKELRKSPMIIADELSQKFNSCNIFESVEAIKGYINFKLSLEFMDEFATNALKNSDDFAKGVADEKILLEYVSANPTGPLHIGHARGAVIGDTLKRVGEHLGYEIDTEYYINDAGNQIYLLGLSIYLMGRERILGKEVEWPEEFYRGEYIFDLAKLAKDEFGENIFENKESIQKLSLWGKDKMLELIKSNLSDVSIEFDRFESELELQDKWDEVLGLLKKNGAVYEKDGKLWLKSSEFGDEKDRVITRDDGRPTYLAGDIIYHYEKYKRGYDRYINIWGADHHGYIARVKASIKFLGFDENRLEILLAQMVSLLKDGSPFKMSKRAGNFILMSDVVNEIGSDALRFIFLSKKSDTHLEFDISDLTKQDSSNPIYYINYAHARIHQLVAKAQKNIDDVIEVKLENINQEAINLLFNALILQEVLTEAYNSRGMQKITEYLKNLASMLHKFYNETKIVSTPHEDEYLKVLAVVALSIKTAFSLMAIEAKNKM